MPRPKLVLNGASGFIGQHLLKALPETFDVTAMSRTRPNMDLAKNVIWHRHEIGREELPEKLPQDLDTFIYLAQSRNYRDFPSQADEIFHVNVAGLYKALSWSRMAGVRRFVLVSSGSVYDSSIDVLDETMSFMPSETANFYQASKRSAEIISGPFREFFPIIVLRPFTVYGPGQREDSLIARLTQSVIEQEKITIANDQGPRLSLTHIDDMVQAILAACRYNSSDVFNVAGPDVLSVREIALAIAQNLDKTAVFQSTEADFVGGFTADTSKLKKLLYSPETCFHEGIKSCLI